MKQDTSKSTVLVITTGFIVLYLLFSWQWAIWVALGVGLLSSISSWISQKIEWLWMQLARILGYIVPNILLTVVFYFFLTVIALISRLFNKDTLMLSPKHTSYFVDIEDKPMNKKSFKNIW